MSLAEVDFYKDDTEEFVPLKKRRLAHTEEMKLAIVKKTDTPEEVEAAKVKKAPTLMEMYKEMQKEAKSHDQKVVKAEVEDSLLDIVTDMKPLLAVEEIAKGVNYTRSVGTSWRPPRHIQAMTKEEADEVRKQFHIICEGEDLPNPILSFAEMRFPAALRKALLDKHITTPTPVQIQGMPAVLDGRDIMGVAFTGSGKTLVFLLPMLLQALDSECQFPLVSGEGPLGLVIAPSRELARQSFDVLNYFVEYLTNDGFPEVRTALFIGGIDMKTQAESVRSGVHCIVATPGRLIHFLEKGTINLRLCRYLVLDEADRLVENDMGHEEEIRKIIDHFHGQRQTLMFSATMPKKIRKFGETAMAKPVVVNVGRAGAANLDVVQEVEYVKQESKLVYLLECLQKSAPPVLIFCENKTDVNDIHEFLLMKGVDAAAIHGGKSQEDREFAIKAFKTGAKDVLVATDVAGKGLDFPDVQHVINYDMPKEIENYVHRIGRTGRCGKTGLATTFINKAAGESVLLDLKHLLKEARQRIPPILATLHDPTAIADELELGGQKGCSYCGGLGHRITECPKLAKKRERDFMTATQKGSGRTGANAGGGEA